MDPEEALLNPPPHLASYKVCLHPLNAALKGELAIREQQCLALNERLRAGLERQGPFDLVYERYSLWSFRSLRRTSSPL